MKLPQSFIERMETQLGDSSRAFFETYKHATIKGIRINTLKISVNEFIKMSPFKLEAIPWVKDGFYIPSDVKPGKHPYYYAGLYYIQEPSAMLPAVLVSPSPGEVILDLCAAPGGKSMQLAAIMENKGLLVANDISSNRLRALIRNAELMGLKNLVVLNEHQERIATCLSNRFDKLLIDAPCSGEGMFKKHDEATQAYEDFNIETCTTMQKGILDEIPKVLKGNGKLIYSTCTFNTRENEEMIQYIMDHHDFEIDALDPQHGFQSGVEMAGVLRLYPHLIKGEGHFAARLTSNNEKSIEAEKSITNSPPDVVVEFMNKILKKPLKGTFKIIKDRVFLLPEYQLPLQGLKVVKEGWYLGDLKKNRFEPSHAMALGLKSDDVKSVISFKADSPEVIKYLKCETLHCEGQDGYNLICVDHYPIGWGKWSKGRLKNLYPSAWRIV